MADKLDYIKIGHRIRNEREKFGLSREKLAEIVELSTFYLGQIERGDRRMSLETLTRIASSLHVSVDYLLYGTKEHNYYIHPKELNLLIKESEINEMDSKTNNNLMELIELLHRCSMKEIMLIKDLVCIIIPHLKG